MIEITNWDKLNNGILSTTSKMYMMHVSEEPQTDYWEKNRKRVVYKLIIEEQFDNNIFSAELTIREVNWNVNREEEILLEIHHLKGIRQSYYLLKKDIREYYSFINILTGLVEKVDDKLMETQASLKALNLTP